MKNKILSLLFLASTLFVEAQTLQNIKEKMENAS